MQKFYLKTIRISVLFGTFILVWHPFLEGTMLFSVDASFSFTMYEIAWKAVQKRNEKTSCQLKCLILPGAFLLAIIECANPENFKPQNAIWESTITKTDAHHSVLSYSNTQL